VSSSRPEFPGVNIYIAGGTGLSGAIPVVLQSDSTGGLGTAGDVNITASIPLDVTSTQAAPVWVTGAVDVGSLSFSGSISATPIEAYPNALENIRYTRKSQRFDLSGDAVNYIGYAPLGSSGSDPTWTIKRMSFAIDGNLEAVAWSGTGSIWDNRSSEIYA
jgi:hypothetical protein